MKDPFFNAHHAPIGALSSLTFGCKGALGGPALEKRWPAKLNFIVGMEEKAAGKFAFFPFMELKEPDLSDFAIDARVNEQWDLRLLGDEEVSREFSLCNDRWKGGDLDFRVISPVMALPDVDLAGPDDLKFALCPAVLVELTLDNSDSDRERVAVFGYQRGEDELYFNHVAHAQPDLTGIVQNRQIAILTRDTVARSAISADLAQIISPDAVEANLDCALGETGLVRMTIPAGAVETVRLAVCFYREGRVTTGMDSEYYYTKLFSDIFEVGRFALDHFDKYAGKAGEAERMIEAATHLSEAQKFMMQHAVRSYYGSTQLLRNSGTGEAIWVVNEGEYLMMNTFDLTVDQLFFEMKMNPWTVRNVLDLYASRYSYRDQVFEYGKDSLYPGGVSFTHDMGAGNGFSRPGWSSYERCGQEGCFSHMTHEQLCNFILCSVIYAKTSGDQAWMSGKLDLLQECLVSLENRDHPDPDQRNGVMGMDSSRAFPASEITTYDSLDASLGQARNNLYLAVKTWAAYVLLADVFASNALDEAAMWAEEQAMRASLTIAGKMTDEGYIPAVMEAGNQSVIIPAVEGLIFPSLIGLKEALSPDGPYGQLMQALQQHLDYALRPGVCIFAENGGYRISSTSRNSWLSKIYLCQHVIRKVMGRQWDDQGTRSDEAHVEWLLHPESRYFAWSDQIYDFKALGSKYYPRGVTSILWLDE